MFDTKIAIILREDLAMWQKLNVTAFLTSGIVGADSELIGQPYEDADGNQYAPLLIQPTIVLSTDAAGLNKIHQRGLSRNLRFALYTEDMFRTGHDEANRAVVKQVPGSALNIVGLALRDDKKTVDKVTRGAKMYA